MDLLLKEYPGRLIIIGKSRSAGKVVIAYAITGRSPSSQARKILFEGATAWVRPTDEEILKQGQPDLLIYPAVRLASGIAVGNGRQTQSVHDAMSEGADPTAVLAAAHAPWEFEPDAPNFTPRISGCVTSGERAALSIIKRSPGGGVLRHYYEFPLTPGEGYLIATYSGENRSPLPSFEGDPLPVKLDAPDAAAAAGELYAALAPDAGNPDFRVSAFCIFAGGKAFGDVQIGIVNRHEEKIKNEEESYG
jgi:IMP cyclohydrolase